MSRVSSYFSLNFHRFFVRLFNLEVPTSRAAPRFVFTTRLNERLKTNLSSVFHALFADVIISCFVAESRDWRRGGSNNVVLCDACREHYDEHAQDRPLDPQQQQHQQKQRADKRFLFKPVKVRPQSQMRKPPTTSISTPSTLHISHSLLS